MNSSFSIRMIESEMALEKFLYVYSYLIKAIGANMDLTLNIIISLLAGVLAGIHSGVVVTRMAKFEELRNQMKHIIWNIDYIYSSASSPQVSSISNIAALTYLSSDFHALKHHKAGETSSYLSNSVNAVFHKPPHQVEDMNTLYADWQKTCRELKPNLRVIFSLRPWV